MAPVPRRLLFSLLASTTALACSSAPPPPERPRPPPEARAAARSDPPSLLAEVPAGTVGPFLGAMPRGFVALWAEPTESGEFEWVTRRVGESGLPEAPQRLGPAPPGLRLVRLRTSTEGIIAVAAAKHADSHQLLSLVLRSDGSSAGAPHQLDAEGNQTLWLECLTTPGGALVLWAEHQGSRAAIYALALGDDGRPRQALTRLYSDAVAWQAVQTPAGALVVVIGSDGTLRTLPIDADGQPGSATVIEDQGRAHHDLDLIREPGAQAALVVYSRTHLLEPELFSARIGFDGALLEAPQRLTAPLGPTALWGVWATPQHSYLAWEHTVQGQGQLNLSRLEARRTSEATVVLEHAASIEERLTPIFAPHADGVAVIARACPDRACAHAHWPTLLKFGPELQLRSATALTAEGKPLDAVWDLKCPDSRCMALGAQYTQPPRIWLQQEGEPRSSGRSPLTLPRSSSGARVRSLQAITSRAEPLAAIAAARVGDRVLLASLSDFDPNLPYERPETPAPDGRLAPVRAQLYVQALPQADEPFVDNRDFGEPQTVSIRARSIAGVDLAVHERQALLAWTAIDNQHPQLFLTIISDRGQRLRQSMLTKQSGEILGLRIATQDAGWAVAWIDDRNGSPGIYTTRVNRALRRLNPDTPLAGVRGDASGLDVLQTSDGLWVLSTHVDEGTGRVVLSHLDSRTLQPGLASVTLDEAAGRAAQPQLETLSDGSLLVAWLRSASGSALHWQKLSVDGGVQGAVQTTRLDGEATSLRLSCSAHCVAAVGLRDGSRARLEVVDLEAPASTAAIQLVSVRAAGVAPALVREQAYLFDEHDGTSAVHRAILGR